MFIEDMRERYIISRWRYLMGDQFLSDIEYDKLEKEFKERFPNDEYSNRSWAFDPCPTDILTKYGLTEFICNPVMGYQAESIYSLNTEAEFDNTFKSLSMKSRVSFKIDGWNFKASYMNGVLVKLETRGRSGSSKDCTFLHGNFPSRIKYKGRVSVTGELSIPNKKWTIYKLMTGNTDQRASVSTAISRGDAEYLDFLAFNIFIEDGTDADRDHYEILRELGFKTPTFKWVTDYDSLVAAVKYFSLLSNTYNYLVDGLVIENSTYQLAIRIGAWEEKSNKSYVVGYDEMQGMYGVSMVVCMKPVKVGSKTCSRVTITNIANICENNLEIGAPISFNIRSAANNVLDVTETYSLQKQWKGRYDEYRKLIDGEETN